MKIFVTGDNHIGRKYASHSARTEIISERIAALSRMAKKANADGCELFAVTGDLFENVSGIARKHIIAVAEALSEFNGIAAILPGNHDHYDESAEVWKIFAECSEDKDNIVVMTEYRPYEFEELNAVIYPAFCDKRHSETGENRLGWIKKEISPDVGKYHIGMAHGAVEGETLDSEGEYFMMTRGELKDIPVDVWLVGHTHVPFPKTLTDEFTVRDERIFNAGTHVQTDISNHTEGLCFILDIDKQKNIRAKKYVSGGIRFYGINAAVTAGNMERGLADALRGLGDNSVVYAALAGAVSEEEYARRHTIVEQAFGRFLEYECSDSGLTRLITEELVKKELPDTSLAARLLMELLDDPKEAQLVYDLITEIKEGR